MADKKEKIKKSALPAEEKVQVIDYREVGATGLRRFSGFIFEEFLLELTGWKGIAIFKEMSTNDPTISGMLFAIRMLCRRVPWRTVSASTMPFDEEAAEFLETCMNDMANTWIDTIDEVLGSMLPYGYAVNEIVYKRRCGDSFDPSMRSKHSDGRIGWRKFPIRSCDTIYRWQFDDHGGIQGVEQLAPPHYYHVTIPIEKMLLFRTSIDKNNPEGRSLLRGAYRPWYLKKNIENIEGVGVERDLAGLPVALVPPEILSKGASDGEKNLLGAIKDIVVNIRRDAQEGVVFPQAYDTNGKSMYELKLLSTGGSRQFDTDKIIQRYDQRIMMTCLADFMLLGHEKVGSFALASSKTQIFTMAMGGILDMVAEIFNRYAIPRLFALNDFQISDYPRITHGDLQQADLKEVGEYFKNLSLAGCPLFPNEELTKWLLKIANAPEPADELADMDMQIDPKEPEMPDTVKEIPATPPKQIEPTKQKPQIEIPDVPVQTPSGLSQPSDTTPVNGKPPVARVVTNQNGDTERNSFQGAEQATVEALRNAKRLNFDY